MRPYSIPVGVFALAAFSFLSNGVSAQDPPVMPNDYEVLTRGPVHEAYAEPVDFKPEPGPVASKAPPDPVEEIPPEQKPDGDDVEWIPGYWAWDEEEKEFLWVSGFWRDVPPGRRWVPGTWHEADDGWHWTPGFWAPEEEDGVEYTPPPPANIDAGPNTAPPSETHIWIPGCWVWREARFYWRPGFWCPHYPNWVWVPARYVWVPGGCIFVEGYWDHPFHLRGLLCAPVRFPPRILAAGFRFTPRHVIQTDFLLTSLFVGPARRHYFFGDYFDDRYETAGFTAWINYQPTRGVFSPMFGYYRSTYSRHPEWTRSLISVYQGRRSGDIPRPPRTLVQQQQVINNITRNRTTNVNVSRDINITNIQNVSVVAPITQVNNTEVTALSTLVLDGKTEAKAPKRVLKLQEIDADQRAQQRERAAAARKVAEQRRRVESAIIEDGGVREKAKTERPPRLELPKVKDRPPPKKDATRTKLPDRPVVPKMIERERPKDDKPPPAIRPPAKKQRDTGKGFPIPPRKDVTPPKKIDPPKDVDPPPRKIDPPKDVDPPPRKIDPPRKKDNPPPKKGPPPKKKDKDKGKGDGYDM